MAATSSDRNMTYLLEKADFKKCLRESQFTFLVGPEEDKIGIHPSIIRKLSEPLYKLMTNGSLAESVTGVAKLPEVDPDTFVHFCEYAYSGAYRVEGKVAPPIVSEPTISFPLKQYHCWFCGEMSTSGSTASDFPFCIPSCRHEIEKRGAVWPRSCIICGETQTHGWETNQFNSNAQVICIKCAPGGRCMTMHMIESESRKFSRLQFSVGAMTHAEVVQYLLVASPEDKPNDNVVAHARLWVFADMYLTAALKDLCLHKLHRDLAALAVTEEMVPEVCRLVAYVYQQASTAADSEHGSFTPRTMVRTYVMQHREALLRHNDFKQLLNQGGEFVVDIITEMGKYTTWPLSAK